MSRKVELQKLAKLFHSQARLTTSPAVKRTLRKLGDYYQHEAEHLTERPPSSENPQPRPKLRHREQTA